VDIQFIQFIGLEGEKTISVQGIKPCPMCYCLLKKKGRKEGKQAKLQKSKVQNEKSSMAIQAYQSSPNSKRKKKSDNHKHHSQ